MIKETRRSTSAPESAARRREAGAKKRKTDEERATGSGEVGASKAFDAATNELFNETQRAKREAKNAQDAVERARRSPRRRSARRGRRKNSRESSSPNHIDKNLVYPSRARKTSPKWPPRSSTKRPTKRRDAASADRRPRRSPRARELITREHNTSHSSLHRLTRSPAPEAAPIDLISRCVSFRLGD